MPPDNSNCVTSEINSMMQYTFSLNDELPASPPRDDCVYIMRRHIEIINSYHRLSYDDFFSGEGISDQPESLLQLQYAKNDRTGMNVMESRKDRKLSITHPDITNFPSIVTSRVFEEIVHPPVILQRQLTHRHSIVTQPHHTEPVASNEYDSVLKEFFSTIVRARRNLLVHEGTKYVMVNNRYLSLSQTRKRGIPIEVSEEEYYGDRTGVGNSGLISLAVTRPRCYFNFSKKYYTDPVHYMSGVSVESMAVMEGFDGSGDRYKPMCLEMDSEASWDLYKDEEDDEESDFFWRTDPRIYTPERLLQLIDIQTPMQYSVHKQSNIDPGSNVWLFWVISNFEDHVRNKLISEGTYLLVNRCYELLSPQEKRMVFIECSDAEFFKDGPTKNLIDEQGRLGKHSRVYTPRV